MNRFIRALVLVMIATCAVFVTTSTAPSFAAQGDILGEFTYTSSYQGASGVVSHGDGSATYINCPGEMKTYAPGGSLQQTQDGTSPTYCGGQGNVGVDGTLYYMKYSGHWYLTVNKLGVEVARHDFNFSGCSGTVWGTMAKSVVGADGNLYAIITANNGCAAHDKLVGIDGADGSLRFSTDVSSNQVSNGINRLLLYNQGIVYFERSTSVSGGELLSYYDFSGTRDSALSCEPKGTTDPCGFNYVTGEGTSYLLVTPDGTSYLETYRSSGGACSGMLFREVRYTTTGAVSSPPRPSNCDWNLVNVRSDGSLVYTTAAGVKVLSSIGTTLLDASAYYKVGHTVSSALRPTVDGTGGIVYERVAQPTGSSDKYVFIDRINMDGTWTTLFSSASFATSGADIHKFMEASSAPSGFALAGDQLFVTFCVSSCLSGTAQIKVLRVDSPGVGFDYPRSAILESAIDNQLDYVALGDSFSSGEGNSPYLTDLISNASTCHRSTNGYPIQLDRDASTDLNLQAFRACTGATIADVVVGKSGEPGQLDFINSNTDVVTLTIGGNDIGFAEFATACTLGYCGMDSTIYDTTIDNIYGSLGGNLEDLYGDILDKNPSLKLYVIGYPYITPEVAPATVCWPFNEGANNPDPETGDSAAAYNVVDSLDSVIQTKVASVAMSYGPSRIEYVDPNASESGFIGHDWCSSDSFFAQVNLSGTQTSYHPDADGMTAYADLLKGAL